MLVSGGGGGGGGGTMSTVGFNPAAGTYSGTSLNVTISVTGASKLRWKIDSGGYTTVTGTSTVVSVTLSVAGHTLYADALSSASVVLASNSAFYNRNTG